MRTKDFPLFAILALCAALPVAAQTTQSFTLTSGKSLPVQTNQLVSVIGYDWNDITVNLDAYNVPVITRPSLSGFLADGSTISLTPSAMLWGKGSTGSPIIASSQIPQIATGLTNIYVSGGWATFKIETPSTTTVVSNYVPADAIVIPASATGNVQVILESSLDLVNWTAANPGTYGASAGTNRFFRVRAALGP